MTKKPELKDRFSPAAHRALGDLGLEGLSYLIEPEEKRFNVRYPHKHQGIKIIGVHTAATGLDPLILAYRKGQKS